MDGRGTVNMAYGVTDDGFVVKPFSVIRAELETDLRAGIDPLLDTDDQGPVGQLIAVFGGAVAELWELGAATYAARYPGSASGSALDEAVSLTGTERDPSTKSQVVGQVTLDPNKALPAGSVAHLSGRPNARFITLAEVPADPSGGTFSVTFEAEDAGFLDVLPTQLNTIAEPVSGWTAVTNAAGAIAVGTDAESDSELRIKQALERTASGSTNVDAIRADLLQLAGVIDATVTEDLAARTMSAVVRGGTAQDIYDQLFASRAAGIRTLGTASGTTTDSQGIDHSESYTPAVAAAIHVDVTIETSAAYPIDGDTQVKTAIAAYVNGLGIGADVLHDLTKCAAYEVAGVLKVTALLQGIGSPATAADVAVGAAQYATADVANIAVTVV